MMRARVKVSIIFVFAFTLFHCQTTKKHDVRESFLEDSKGEERCAPAFRSLVDDGQWYRVNNATFHADDDVSDHATWSALAVEEWVKKNDPWVKTLPKDYIRLGIYGAFLHDIGKTGDRDFKSLVDPGWKINHPEVGFEMAIGSRPYVTIDDSIADQLSKIDQVPFPLLTNKDPTNPVYDEEEVRIYVKRITDLVSDSQSEINLIEHVSQKSCFNPTEKVALAVAIGMHYNFGNILKVWEKKPADSQEMQARYKTYLETLMNLVHQAKGDIYFQSVESKKNLVALCALVAAADVRGSQPVRFLAIQIPFLNEIDSKIIHDEIKPNNYEKFGYDGYVVYRDALLSAVEADSHQSL